MEVIEVASVSKRYQLGQFGAGTSLRETIATLARPSKRSDHQEFWALDEVSFGVLQGRTLGIIGRNGSGKSTLLKILSRITEPTSGLSRTRGRVASLLEVGTGFHEELTGRDNIYLNGAIHGMTRRDIDDRFDDMVEFSGVGDFLDTPIKRYSTGMHLRLAFSVAAHLEPDILIVDEVLAVGDAEFQRRCLGRMQEAERDGRTVVFVSHDLSAVERLCERTIWLAHGKVKEDGPTADVLQGYGESFAEAIATPGGSWEAGPVTLHGVTAVDPQGIVTTLIDRAQPFEIELDLTVERIDSNLDLSVYLTSVDGVRAFEEVWSDSSATRFCELGPSRVRIRIPPIFSPGTYQVGVWFGTHFEDFLLESSALQVELVGGGGRPFRVTQLGIPYRVMPGDTSELESERRRDRPSGTPAHD